MTTFALVHSPLVGPVTWLGVADALEAAGSAAVVCELHDHGAPFWLAHSESAATQIRRAAPDGPLVLVAHSGAGALMPPLRRALDSREIKSVVFVDAGIPSGGTRLEAFAADAPGPAAELSEHLARGGRFPDWSDQDLAALVPGVAARRALLASIRPRGLDYWTEPIPVYQGWPDVAGGFVLLSPAYRRHAEAARTREWPVVEIGGAGHFHAMVDPAAVAAAIIEVSG